MDATEQPEPTRPAVDVQLLTFAQMATAIRYSSFFYPKIHPSITAAVIAASQLERPEKWGRRGRKPDPRIDEACARWDKGLRDIDDYADLLPQNTRDEMREPNFRSLKSAIGKRHRANILAAEAQNVAEPRLA